MTTKKKYKLLFIHHGSVPGGAPTSLRNLISGFSDKEMDIVVGCVHKSMISFFAGMDHAEVVLYPMTALLSGRLFIAWSKISFKSVKAVLLDLFHFPAYLWREIKFIRKINPDVVHLNSSVLWVSAIAARLCRASVVWHIREASFDTGYNLVRICYAWLIRLLASQVICIGPLEYKKICAGRKRKHVRLVYNSVDQSFFVQDAVDKKELRRRLGLPLEAFIYISLGGDSFRKGAFQLLESLSFTDNSMCLVMAGHMPEKHSNEKSRGIAFRHKVEDFLVQKGLKRYYSWGYSERLLSSLEKIKDKQLHCPGIVVDIKPYLQACDVLVFAGTTPHSARPVYEAWALKKPVVVFDTEVMRMDVDDGVDGMIVKEHTAQALAKSLKKLQAQPDLCPAMGEVGYTKAVERFSLKKNTEKIMDIYREVLSEGGF